MMLADLIARLEETMDMLQRSVGTEADVENVRQAIRLLRAGEKAQAILRASLDSPCFDCERAYVDAKSSEAALREWDEAERMGGEK